MKLTLTLVAQEVILDVYSNTFSAFKILEEIASPSFPVALPSIDWLLFYERDDEEEQTPTVTLSVELNGEKIHEVDRELGFGNKLRFRSRVAISGLPLSNPGKLELVVRHGDKTLGSYAIRINSIAKVEMKVDEA